MKHLNLILFFSISLAAFSLKGQETGYMEGYIITNSNDTLIGFVKNRNLVPYRVLERIKFKKNQDSKVESFAPDQLMGFRIGDHYFISKNTTAVSGVNEKFFLEIIVEGFLSYYELEHTSLGVSNATKYVILERFDEENQLTYIVNSIMFNFKKSVTEYISDAPALCDKINRGFYKRKDITQIVKEFNSITIKN